LQEPTPATPDKIGRATVESLDIRILESFPVQVHVTIKGYVSDSCTTAGPIEQERDGNTFRITVGATRPGGAMCAQVITPFEQSIALDVAGLKAGTYTVDANGVTGTFELTTDNVLP
jgi:inhibitor of cysteine peptidase